MWSATVGTPTLAKGEIKVNVTYTSTGGESFVEPVNATPGDSNWLARTIKNRLKNLDWADTAMQAVVPGPFTPPADNALEVAQAALTSAIKKYEEGVRLVNAGASATTIGITALKADVVAAYQAREAAKV